MIRLILLAQLSCLKVESWISDQNLSVAQRLYFIPIRIVLHFQEVSDLHQQQHRELDQHLIGHQAVLLVLDERLHRLALDSQHDQELQKGISANQMLRKRISKQLNEEQNTSSHFSQQQKRMTILSVVRRASEEKNKKKMWMISDRHSWIDLVKKSKLEISSRSKNSQTR